MCGSNVAQFECKMCYQKRLFGDGSGIASYCADCNSKVHSHRHRADHKPRPILLPRQYISERRMLDKQTMELFAVVCIETSHYVAFVKCGIGVDAPWCFFDSMADRKGEINQVKHNFIVRSDVELRNENGPRSFDRDFCCSN